MKLKLHIPQALVFSLFIALGSLLLPHTTHASTLFLDEFNGSNTTLEQYNSDYHSMSNGVNTDPIYVATDHAYTLYGYGAFALLTGLSQSDNCTSIDFRSDGWVSILLRTTDNFVQTDRIDLVDGSWWRYFHNGYGITEQGNLDPALTFDRFNPTIHTLKACANGTTLTAYIDNQQFWTGQSTNTGGYSGFGAYEPTAYLDNFRIESTNQRPIVGTVTISPNPVTINTPVTASATFTDADTGDTHTATIDWGDGTGSHACTVTENNGTVSCSLASGYSSANVYPVTITVSDGTASGNSPTAYASVYNPTQQGIFTAASKYTSPAGAYLQNTSLTGNVIFGLSYKYQGTMPVGVRQFSMDFNVANFHFNATSVDSLVISNGIGTLRGAGTLNGIGGYTFLVTGSESANTIRIQIKDSTGSTVYDTQPTDLDTATPTTTVTGNVLAH